MIQLKKLELGWMETVACLLFNLEPDADMKFEQNIDMKMYINHNLTINFP